MTSHRKFSEAIASLRQRRWREGVHWFLAEFFVVVVGVLLVESRTEGRGDANRLSDDNSDPRTKLAGVQSLLDEAIAAAQRVQPSNPDH